MANYNKVILVGNLTRDPQLRYIASAGNMPVVDFGLAINHRYRTKSGEDREEVCFIECSAFGKPAEIINQYCTKGRPLMVDGRLKLDTWEDKQGGGKRSKHVVVVENFQLLGSRGDAPGGGGPPAAGGYEDAGDSAPPARTARPPARAPARPAPAPAPQPPFGDEENFKDEDIPF
jgi:single-strand DNA-binding protein